ncbi:hypothetical protein ACOMHN_029929 [Nucella lapillus]
MARLCEWLGITIIRHKGQHGHHEKEQAVRRRAVVLGCDGPSNSVAMKPKCSFKVGTEEHPIPSNHQVKITLHGHLHSKELPIYGTKSLALREGTLDLHGEFVTQSCLQGRFGKGMGSDEFGAQILIHGTEKNTPKGEALCCQPYGEVHHSTRSAIKCHGNETSLHHCTRHFVNISPLLGAWLGESTSNETKLLTKCEKHDYAAVVCHNSSAPSESGIHLSIAGPSSFTGRLVVTYDGVLGGVCGEGWNQQAADRACKDLGYNHGANYTHAHVVDAAAGPVWTANVSW